MTSLAVNLQVAIVHVKNKRDFEIISKNLVNAHRTFQNIDFFKNGVSLKKETRFYGKNRPKIG